jgi:hypothetical protein
MNVKDVEKKFKLNKETIAVLNSEAMDHALGGAEQGITTFLGQSCWLGGCRTLQECDETV